MRPTVHLSAQLTRSIWDHVPTAAYFIKDREHRYVAANAAMLRICGVSHERDLVGYRSKNFFSDDSSSRGENVECELFKAGGASREQLQNVIGKDGRSHWLVIRRWPIVDVSHTVTGIVGLGRILPKAKELHALYASVASAAEQIAGGYSDTIEVADIARRVGLSIDRLEREFASIFGMAPRDYITKTRLAAAVERLSSGDSIAEIAHSCGYSDQSAFSRRFKSVMDMSPTKYRSVLRATQQY